MVTVLSQKTRYALKALLELAALPGGTTLSAAAISARRSIPAKFLAAILFELKRDGLVRGLRGRSGGYRLARGAADISFGIVLRSMAGRDKTDPRGRSHQRQSESVTSTFKEKLDG